MVVLFKTWFSCECIEWQLGKEPNSLLDLMSSQRQYLLSGPKLSIYICISKWFYLDFLGMPNNPEQQYLECRKSGKHQMKLLFISPESRYCLRSTYFAIVKWNRKEFRTSFFTVFLVTVGVGMSCQSAQPFWAADSKLLTMVTHYCFPHSLCHVSLF